MRDLLRSQRRSAPFADLLDAARDGQPWAVEELADRFLARLAAFAAARGATDPQGVADVVLQRVLGRLDQFEFEAPEQFWAYLCLAARSRVIDEHRRAKPLELVGDSRVLDGVGTGAISVRPADVEDVVAQREYISALLSPLTPGQRQVLELRFLNDLSVEETASRTGRSEGAIKGLQRRAINAILAALAIVVLALTLQAVGAVGGDRSGRIESDPADGGGPPPVQPDLGTDRSGPTEGSGSTDDSEQGARLVAGETQESPAGDVAESADGADGGGTPGSLAGDGRFTVTVGSAQPADLHTAGQPGPEDFHGVRIRCAVSHFSHSDPIRFPGRAGASRAQVHWGNTSVDATAGSVDLTRFGNGTCDGGVTDRSAYAMPALFDENDEAVVPDWVFVEYKSFGGPGFDRSTIQPIPAGLQLVSGPAVNGGAGLLRAPSGGAESVTFHVLFPSCVAVDQSGRPVLSSADNTSHLSYQTDAGRGPNGCPTTHPVRIPQLSFTVTYRVPLDSGWYLATGPDPAPGHRAPTGSAISAWDPGGMAGLVTCLRDLLDGCWFGVDSAENGRPHLPERFTGPDGRAVYDDSLLLAEQTDRTPFGNLLAGSR